MSKSNIKLFISHSERDKVFVEPLAGWLQTGLGLCDADVRCTSVTNIKPGAIAADTLRQDLVSAKVILGVLTENSLKSYWAQLEIGAGWMKNQLHPIRGPGVTPEDLPPPHNGLTTVGYCEKAAMLDLMHDLAARLQVSVHPEAELRYEEIVRSAEETLMADRVRWFSLPPVLAAWRIDRDTYNHARLSLCEELTLDPEELSTCVTPEGILIQDPEEVPTWAKDVWTVSKYAVNAMLDHSTGYSGGDRGIPPKALPPELIAEMENALRSSKHRSNRLREWFAAARQHISENPPSVRPITSPRHL